MPLGAFKTAMLGAAGGGSSGDAWYAVYTGAYDSSNSYGDFDIGLDTTNELLYVGGRGTKTDQNYARLLGVLQTIKLPQLSMPPIHNLILNQFILATTLILTNTSALMDILIVPANLQ